jgi:hypothetical protein
VRRLEDRQSRVRDKLCAFIDCESKSAKPSTQTKAASDTLAALRAELDTILIDYSEKKQISTELSRELNGLNERSRPLEELLRKWHERARLVCDAAYLKFLCPVDNPKLGEADHSALKRELEKARDSLAKATDDAERRRDLPPQSSALARLLNLDPTALALKGRQREVDRLEQDLSSRDADRFRSIVVEVRIIVANIGAYLIAMVMGVLGSLTFILRSLSHQLKEHTYVPISASTSIVRVCLGSIAGVFGTLLLPNSDTAMRSLPPLFVPFVFGYGIEILFSLLDKVVRSFTQAGTESKQTPTYN